MKTKTTALIASTLLTGLLSSSVAFAALDDDKVITGVSSANLSEAVKAELFPTDLPLPLGERVNYSIDNTPISEALDAELFPDTNS